MDDEESPPRKRARMLSKACEMCKIKKSRCDSARPCGLCQQKGTKCEYREKGQPGLRPGYGKAMESRMAVLEDSMLKISESMQEVLQQLQRGQLPAPSIPVPDQRGAPRRTQSTAQSMSAGSGSEHGSPGDETPDGSTAGDTSMHSSISGSRANAAFSGPPPPPLWQPAPPHSDSSGQTFPLGQGAPAPNDEWLSLSPAITNKTAPEILASMASAKPLPAATETAESTAYPAEPAADLPGLPPREVLHELVELFFDHIYPWAPLFYKPDFVRSLASASSTGGGGDEKLLLLHGITVLCFRFWTKPTPTPELREAYINASRDQVLLRTIDACSLVSTQALALLALDAVGQGPGPRTWNIMAMLVAAARQLILATRTPNRPRDEANTPVVNDEGDDEVGDDGSGADGGETRRRRNGPGSANGVANGIGAGHDQSTIEAEEKRRLFWVIYSLDRFASIFHGQPGAIDTKTIRLLYPSSDDEWGMPSASPEWFQGTSDSSSSGQSSNGDASAGSFGGSGGMNFNYANLSSSNSSTNGGSINSLGNLGNSSSSHANCSANLWHHYIDALTLVDRSHRLLIQPVNVSVPAHCQEWQSNFRRLDLVLTAWFENLPAFVREGLPGQASASSASVSSAASTSSSSPPSAPPNASTPSFNPVRAMIYASYLLSFVRMYMIASFPATTSAYLRPSLAARTRLRQVCHDLATLVSMYQPHELQALGPLFVFIVWVGARSLVILWTRGGYSPDELCPAVHKSTSASSSSACMLPPDLETILTSLRHMAARWPCAQRYVDIIQMIIDTKNSPGGPPGLEIFNDPRRTSYVIQSRFKALANGRRASMSRAKGHDAGIPESKTAIVQQQSQHPQYPQYNDQHSYASLHRPQHNHHPYHPPSTQYEYQANPEPLMSMPFSQSLDFFDMPLLESYDLTGTLIGTGTFGTEINSEWL
ncbi:c6 transcription factor [Ophiostoma piceae UAMH 11346]|uniref:C6 transcription factor n=1 Tax=Ophiostoma piceae (strain UAMH 11346) TaxID=1262450 RepID=S3CQ83_OPHP1|nr:c6 transcription factor [Ophiostoma piceae UAMH 11346]